MTDSPNVEQRSDPGVTDERTPPPPTAADLSFPAPLGADSAPTSHAIVRTIQQVM